MEFKTIADAKRQTKMNYFGRVNNGVKHMKAYKYNEMVYTIYFAPANTSGYEVCKGRNLECTKSCLNMSGLNRIDVKNKINESRIKKTKLFFEERDFTMKWIISEIKKHKSIAEKKGYKFSVRLNNTSDISPEDFFIINDKGIKQNILELFPDVMFYDYTKIENRSELLGKYKNYDLTYSFNGYNENKCLEMLNKNIRVSVVFKNKLPNTFFGVPVIDGDLYDMRYKDDKKIVCGLKYKKVRNKLEKDNKFVVENNFN